jgi:hypothetical protein
MATNTKFDMWTGGVVDATCLQDVPLTLGTPGEIPNGEIRFLTCDARAHGLPQRND